MGGSIHEDSSSEGPQRRRSLLDDVKHFPTTLIDEPTVFAATGKRSAFANDSESDFEEFYKPIDSYEGAHRYDPKFEWEPQEEKKLVRKIDYSSWNINLGF